jgi:hypothetical protein
MIPEVVVVATPPMLLDLDNVRFAHDDAGLRLQFASRSLKIAAAARQQQHRPTEDYS